MKNKTIAERLMEKNAELAKERALTQKLQAQLIEANARIAKLEIALTSPTLDEEAKKAFSAIEGIDASNGHITLLFGKEKTHFECVISKDLHPFYLANALNEMANNFGLAVVPMSIAAAMADSLLETLVLTGAESDDDSFLN